MANGHLEMKVRKPAIDTIKSHVLFRFLCRMTVSIIDLTMRLMSGRRELDDLDEVQLRDIGVSVVARRERWLDGTETPLFGEFNYRIAADRPREGESDPGQPPWASSKGE